MSSDMQGIAKPYIGRVLVEDKKIYAPTSTITFYNLEAGIGDFYEIELVKDSSVTSTWLIQVNGNITTTDYYVQSLFLDNTTSSASRLNSSDCIFSLVGSCSMATVICTVLPNGFFGYTSYHGRNIGGATPQMQNFTGGSNFPIDKIQTLTFNAVNAGGIGSGSRLKLFRNF